MVDEEGHRWQRKHDPWRDPEVVHWLEGLVGGSERSTRIVCSEDVYAKRTDEWVTEHPEEALFFCGECLDAGQRWPNTCPELGRAHNL